MKIKKDFTKKSEAKLLLKMMDSQVDQLNQIVSNMEDEIEGDLFEFSHQPEAEKVAKIVTNYLDTLSGSFKAIKTEVFETETE